ncbi:methyl-accepting chemotaxis protein [Paenibacillus sp. OV219]|uniref:methyl-accepting chemotaxis protein n=1 Tax=Paenibacillus sp. OV219 TaxID=1884377 RepID=UPI0008B94CD2|nr:methyl-accepting chemotaxis protein [Paenibacillus sp. OV219]SEO21707.1 Methyl-accepting chemotaxis protein [Paenibacillus sp. OV219]
MRSFSVRSQIILLIAVVLLAPITGIGLYYYHSITSKLEVMDRGATDESAASVEGMLTILSSHVMDVTVTNSHWGDYRTAMLTHDLEWITDNVAGAVDIIPNLDFTVSADYDGNVVLQSGDVADFMVPNISKLGIVQKAKADGDFSGLLVTNKGIAFIAASKITDEENKLSSPGVLIFGRLLNADALSGIASTVGVDVSFYSKLGDTGWIDSDKTGVKEAAAAEKLYDDQMKSNSPGHPIIASLNQADHPYSVKMLSVTDYAGKPIGVLSVARELRVSSEVASGLSKLSLQAGAAALILIAIIGFFIERRIITPLKRIHAYLKQVAEGRLSAQAPAGELKRRDEIGFITGTLQTTVSDLHGIVKGIETTSTSASGTAAVLSGETEETRAGIGQIVDHMHMLTEGAEAQLVGAASGTKAMSGIADGIQQIFERTISVTHSATESTGFAEDGRTSINNAVVQMNHASGSVQQVVNDMQKLEKHSESIVEIAEWIGKIASQTNILALNANIEASRAGEHGKGFAVVADEVRKLAMQAGEAASQVQEQVTTIREQIEVTVAHIEQGHIEVSEGTQLVQTAEHSFSRIADSITSMNVMLQEVAAATEEMTAGSQEMAAMVEQTETVSRNAAQLTKEVSRIAEARAASVNRITSVMSELNEQIQELGSSVTRYS